MHVEWKIVKDSAKMCCPSNTNPKLVTLFVTPLQWRADIAISLFVCLSVREHTSGTAGPIFTNFSLQIPCGCGSVLLWRHCDTLCTSVFMDDITFGRNGPYGDAWKAEPLTY